MLNKAIKTKVGKLEGNRRLRDKGIMQQIVREGITTLIDYDFISFPSTMRLLYWIKSLSECGPNDEYT